MRHYAFATALLGLTLALTPAQAQSAQKDKPPVAPEEDVMVITPRRQTPGHQEYDEFQRAEIEKLRARYEKPPVAEPSGDARIGADPAATSPNDRSDLRSAIRGSGTSLRDLFTGPR